MIFLLIKNIHCNTIFWLTRDIGLNMVKAAMDLTLAINLKQLLRPMKTFIMEVLNLKLVVRPSMVKMDMKWPNGDMGVTNMGRFIFMLIKNRSYQVRFNKSFFLSKNNHNFNILIDIPVVLLLSTKANFKKRENLHYFSYIQYMHWKQF